MYNGIMEPAYPFLRKLLGDAWVEQEVLGNDPHHPLGLWHKKNPGNAVGQHLERALEALISGGRVTFDRTRLAEKLKAEFVPTLTELEWAVFLAKQGFMVIVESCAPKKGPDLQADRDGVSYFIEIRNVGPSKHDAGFSMTCADAFSRLKKIPSPYCVSLAMTGGYSAYSKQLKQAAVAVGKTVEKLKEDKIQRATLYYFSPEEQILNIGGDIEWEPDGYTDDAKVREKLRRYERAQQAGFIARFKDLGEERDHTIVGAHTLVPRWGDDHRRLKQILNRKRTQLPKGCRGFLVLDVSDLLLDEESILSALYGTLQIHIAVGPEGMVSGGARADRAPTGFFGASSRVSAVVIYRRRIENDAIEVQRAVCPTNRADQDTIQLTLRELGCFGEVPNELQHLSAENLLAQGTDETENRGAKTDS